MASIRDEVFIDAPPEQCWDALRDWRSLHKRLAPGFVTDAHLDGDDRIVTFANGLTLREVLIACDEELRRLVWSIVDGPFSHHNGAAEVIDAGDGRTRFVWTSDFLPDEPAEFTRDAMRQGLAAIKRALEGAAVS